MPNHITNVLVISSDDEQMLNRICDAVSSRTDTEYLIGFDFNKVIPMPEELDLDSGSPTDKAVSHALSYLHESGDWAEYTDMKALVFNSKYYKFGDISTAAFLIVPVPSFKIDMDEVELGMQYLNNLKNYGAFSWYDWAQDKWGTKWNSYAFSEFEDKPIPKCAREVADKKKYSRVIRFQTAWDPPFPVYTKFRDMILDFIKSEQSNATAGFDVFYADEDFGSKVGYIHFETNLIANYSETKRYDDMSNTAIELAADIMNTTPEIEGYRIDPETGKYVFDEKLFRSE